jgi:copper chaperone CopZ
VTAIVHDVSGRLRLRIRALKRNQPAATDLKACLGAIPGVASVDANPLTGSLLLVYDPTRTDRATLLAALAGFGHAVAVPAEAPLPAAGRLVAFAVDRLVERSALALLAALI